MRSTGNTSYTQDLLEWIRVQTKGVCRPLNASSDFANGINLCILIDSIIPGACPRYDLLNPEDADKNVNLAINLIRESLSMDPVIRTDRVIRANNPKEMIYLLSRLKILCRRRLEQRASQLNRNHRIGSIGIKLTDDAGKSTDLKNHLNEDQKTVNDILDDGSACFAKGMGLQLAVVGRVARFNLFVKSVSDMNLVIEIIGPKSTGSSSIREELKNL